MVLAREAVRIVAPPGYEPKHFGCPPLDECGELRASRFGECGRELRARADPELAVDAGQVHLDRPLRDEERLCDLPVGRPLGCHLRDTSLARGERVDAAEGDAARAGAGCEELLLG